MTRARRLAPVLLAAALVGLPLAGCSSFADEPACPTLPPGAEVSPLPGRRGVPAAVADAVRRRSLAARDGRHGRLGR